MEGCSEPAERSLSRQRLSGTNLKLKPGERKAHLCRKHYKEFKKETKQERELEKARFRSNLR